MKKAIFKDFTLNLTFTLFYVNDENELVKIGKPKQISGEIKDRYTIFDSDDLDGRTGKIALTWTGSIQLYAVSDIDEEAFFRIF